MKSAFCKANPLPISCRGAVDLNRGLHDYLLKTVDFIAFPTVFIFLKKKVYNFSAFPTVVCQLYSSFVLRTLAKIEVYNNQPARYGRRPCCILLDDGIPPIAIQKARV